MLPAFVQRMRDEKYLLVCKLFVFVRGQPCAISRDNFFG
jgi:hypothetical protein